MYEIALIMGIVSVFVSSYRLYNKNHENYSKRKIDGISFFILGIVLIILSFNENELLGWLLVVSFFIFGGIAELYKLKIKSELSHKIWAIILFSVAIYLIILRLPLIDNL